MLWFEGTQMRLITLESFPAGGSWICACAPGGKAKQKKLFSLGSRNWHGLHGCLFSNKEKKGEKKLTTRRISLKITTQSWVWNVTWRHVLEPCWATQTFTFLENTEKVKKKYYMCMLCSMSHSGYVKIMFLYILVFHFMYCMKTKDSQHQISL